MSKYSWYKLYVGNEDFSMEQGFRITKFDPKNLSEIEFTLPEDEATKLKVLLESSEKEEPIDISLVASTTDLSVKKGDNENTEIFKYVLTIIETDSSSDPWKYKCRGQLYFSTKGWA